MSDEKGEIRELLKRAHEQGVSAKSGALNEVSDAVQHLDADLDLDRAVAEIIRRTPNPPVIDRNSVNLVLAESIHRTQLIDWEEKLRNDCMRTYNDMVTASVEGDRSAIGWNASDLYLKVKTRMLGDSSRIEEAANKQDALDKNRMRDLQRVRSVAVEHGFSATEAEQLLDQSKGDAEWTVGHIKAQADMYNRQKANETEAMGRLLCRGLCAITGGMLVAEAKRKTQNKKMSDFNRYDYVMFAGVALGGWMLGGWVHAKQKAISDGIGGLNAGKSLLNVIR